MKNFEQLRRALTALVRENTNYNFCNITLDDGFLEIKVVDIESVAGISKTVKNRTLLTVDVLSIVPIVYQGSAEAIGTTKYAIAEMIDDLYSAAA